MTEKNVKSIEHMLEKVKELNSRTKEGFQLEGYAVWTNRNAYNVLLEWAISNFRIDEEKRTNALSMINGLPIIVVDEVPVDGTMFYVGTAAEVQGFINYISYDRRN